MQHLKRVVSSGAGPKPNADVLIATMNKEPILWYNMQKVTNESEENMTKKEYNFELVSCYYYLLFQNKIQNGRNEIQNDPILNPINVLRPKRITITISTQLFNLI